MQFQLFHKKYFKALDGAYSRVTEREEYDSQITLTDQEAEMVVKYFGIENLQVGNVGSNKEKASKQFFLYPDYDPIHLNLVFPKPRKQELRLYISERAGFKPRSGEIWFLYLDDNKNLIIGALPEAIWNDLDQIDIEDSDYQSEIEETIFENAEIKISPAGKIITSKVGEKTVFIRDPKIAIVSLQRASFLCEVDPSHQTFIAEKTKRPYVEAHHFIPMKFQSDFQFPLDCIDNVISLCPNCHRGIHLGVLSHKQGLIQGLFNKRRAINNFDLEMVFSFYNSLTVM